MKTLFRICTVLMFAGTASLMAADEEPAKGTRGPRMQERGERGPRGEHGPRGGHGRFSMLICPNCHHKLIVLAPDGRGHGGREGREGREWRGGRGGKRGPRGQRPAAPSKPATTPETPAETK